MSTSWKRNEACVGVFNQCQVKRCETCVVYSDRSDIVDRKSLRSETPAIAVLQQLQLYWRTVGSVFQSLTLESCEFSFCALS